MPEYHRERPAEIWTEPEYRECPAEIGTVGNYAICERRLVIQEGLVISSLACNNFPLLCNLQLIVYKLIELFILHFSWQCRNSSVNGSVM